MSYAHNGDVEIFYETFGDPADPALLLVNGLGSQCITYRVEWCEKFAAEGFHVIRFDNRDVGLSTTSSTRSCYSLDDMAADAFAVLDAVGAERGPRDGRVDGRDDRAGHGDRAPRPAAVDDIGDVDHR